MQDSDSGSQTSGLVLLATTENYKITKHGLVWLESRWPGNTNTGGEMDMDLEE